MQLDIESSRSGRQPKALPVLRSILQSEGVKGLFRGFAPSLIHTALRQIYFWLYEHLRSVIKTVNEAAKLIPPSLVDPARDALAGFGASFAYQAICNPFDIIVQRLMVQSKGATQARTAAAAATVGAPATAAAVAAEATLASAAKAGTRAAAAAAATTAAAAVTASAPAPAPAPASSASAAPTAGTGSGVVSAAHARPTVVAPVRTSAAAAAAAVEAAAAAAAGTVPVAAPSTAATAGPFSTAAAPGAAAASAAAPPAPSAARVIAASAASASHSAALAPTAPLTEFLPKQPVTLARVAAAPLPPPTITAPAAAEAAAAAAASSGAPALAANKTVLPTVTANHPPGAAAAVAAAAAPASGSTAAPGQAVPPTAPCPTAAAPAHAHAHTHPVTGAPTTHAHGHAHGPASAGAAATAPAYVVPTSGGSTPATGSAAAASAPQGAVRAAFARIFPSLAGPAAAATPAAALAAAEGAAMAPAPASAALRRRFGGPGPSPLSPWRFPSLALARDIYRADGVSAFYRGVISSALLFSTSSALWWGTFSSLMTALDPLADRWPWLRTSRESLRFLSDGTALTPPLLSERSVDLLADHPWWTQHFAAAVAGVASIALTNPIDVCRTRLMVLARRGDGLTMRVLFKRLLKEEGPRALMAGAVPRTLSYLPISMAIMTVYQVSKVVALEVRISRDAAANGTGAGAGGPGAAGARALREADAIAMRNARELVNTEHTT
jgi:hypothetical protein